jgi:transcriptional regulator with XRE-family HTH domain
LHAGVDKLTPDDAFLIALGQRLRDLRHERGWSQEDFAERVPVHRTYIGGIERGERNITVLVLNRLAQALELGPDELLRGLAPRGVRG